jgi:peptidoglycan/LPS O-acetylase OafA/YrhL
MVAIFFVVGGYVISIKPLRLIHSGQTGAFNNTIVSSMFRRGIRLYLPALTATFITMVTVYIGLWEYPRQFITEDRQYIFYADSHPTQLPSFGWQLSSWFRETKLLTNVFTYYNNGFMLPYYPHYDPHLWTVPFEYRSSTLLALALIAFSRCQTRARVILMACTIIYCGVWDRWELVCFLGGSLLCELDTVSNILSNPNSTPERPEDDNEDEEKLPDFEACSNTQAAKNSLSLYIRKATCWIRKAGNKRLFSAFLIFLSLYLLSSPNFSIESTPGYAWLTHIIPSSYTDPKRFPHTLGALLITFCTTRSTALQRVFNSPFAQYLGKTSYALYIVHGPLIHIVGYSVTPNVWRYITGMETAWQWWLGLGIGSAILGTCVAVITDWFWRVVDVWSVSMCRRVEGWCFVSDER